MVISFSDMAACSGPLDGEGETPLALEAVQERFPDHPVQHFMQLVEKLSQTGDGRPQRKDFSPSLCTRILPWIVVIREQDDAIMDRVFRFVLVGEGARCLMTGSPVGRPLHEVIAEPQASRRHALFSSLCRHGSNYFALCPASTQQIPQSEPVLSGFFPFSRDDGFVDLFAILAPTTIKLRERRLPRSRQEMNRVWMD